MKIEINENNIEKFKEFLKQEEREWEDEDDIAYELNKFIELNLDLIF